MFDLQDKVFIITGSGGALGRVAVKLFHQAGAKVSMVDLRAESLESLFDELAQSERAFIAPSTNLTDPDAVEAMVDATVSQFGQIDGLINIAGGFTMGPPLHETSLSDWDKMIAMNAKTVFLACRAVIPHLLKQEQGRIVSVAARAGLEGAAKMAPYCASKSAVIRLTESMSAELKDQGITVNCIMPGTIDTPRNRDDMPKANFDKWVPPQDLVNVMLFLASPAARSVTGAAVPVYGRS